MKITTGLFNLRQRVRSLLCQSPLLCHHSSGSRAFCKHGCAPGETFQCEVCERMMPFCRGAGDDYESICDECWAIADQLETVVAAGAVDDDIK